MKVLNFLAFAVLLAALAGIPAFAQMSQDQQQQPTQTQPSQPQAGAADPSSQQGQAFTGTVVKTKGGYMLQDESSKSSFMLDDQAQAKKFSGKNVKVTGTLDNSTNTIHVSNIELVSNSY